MALPQQRLKSRAQAGGKGRQFADIAGTAVPHAAVGVQGANGAIGHHDGDDQRTLGPPPSKPAQKRGRARCFVGAQQRRRRRRHCSLDKAVFRDREGVAELQALTGAQAVPADGVLIAQPEDRGKGQKRAGVVDGDAGNAFPGVLGGEVGEGLDHIPRDHGFVGAGGPGQRLIAVRTGDGDGVGIEAAQQRDEAFLKLMPVGGAQPLPQPQLGNDVGHDGGFQQFADLSDQHRVQRRQTGHMQGVFVVDKQGHQPHRHRHAAGEPADGPGFGSPKNRGGHRRGLPNVRQDAGEGGFVGEFGLEDQRIEAAAVDELLVDGDLQGCAVNDDAMTAGKQGLHQLGVEGLGHECCCSTRRG